MKSEIEVAQSCPTLSDPMDCSLPGSSVHGIFQVRVLEWGAISFSDHYLKPSTKYLLRRNQTQSVEEKTWSQGPGNKGPEAGAGKGVNLGGGDSAFVCITSMHRMQYD